MEILVPFLNETDLTRHISSTISNILNYQHDFTQQEKEIESLTRLLDVLPNNIQLNSIPIACELFDYLIQNSPSIHHYRLLSSCMNFMTIDDRLKRIQTIVLTILDPEQSIATRELLCKLLNTTDSSLSTLLSFDWDQFESALRYQHDPKFITYIWHFLAKHHQTTLENILLRTLPNIEHHDELFLLLLIEMQSIEIFLSMSSFWYLIQRSLGDRNPNNDRIRKCALFLFKQILTNEKQKHVELRDDQYDRKLILINDKTKQFWIDFVVVYEALEDGIVHLIKPILTKFDRLLNFAREQNLSLTWMFILLERLFANTSSPLCRWTVRWFLNSMKLPDAQIENFFLSNVLDWISNHFVFLRGDEINDSQPIEQYLESYFHQWLTSTSNPGACLLTILSRIQSIKWSHLSLERVLYSLRRYSQKHQSQSLLNDEHIKLFLTLILTHFQTFAPVLRLSSYSSIVDIVINLFDWSTCSTSTNLLRFFAYFDRTKFLSKYFPLISQHFSFNLRQIQNLIDEFLSSEEYNSSPDTRLFSIDEDLIQTRQTAFLLDLLDNHNVDILKALFLPLMENIRTVHQRPYMSINNVRRSIELFFYLNQEHYFHSTNFVKNWLSANLRLIVREGLDFIKTHCASEPMVFSRLSIVFLTVGNHGDISRFLQDLINQIETILQQSKAGWQTYVLLFAHSINWLLTNRSSDFDNDWNNKLRLLPLFSKILSSLDQSNAANISQADILIAKYLLVANRISSNDLCNQIVDDLYKASPRELPYIFRAISVLLRQTQVNNDDKYKLIETSMNVINEIDHRTPVYWPCLTTLCQAISSSSIEPMMSNLLSQWFHQMLAKYGHVSGIANTILESVIPIWSKEHRVQSEYFSLIVECIIFGQLYQKDKKQQWQAEQLVEQDESTYHLIISTQTIPEYRYDRNVRILSQLFLLHIWPSLTTAQQTDLLMKIIEKHRCLASKERRPRFCTNSLEHRIMFRSLQCLLCLTSIIKDSSLLKIIYDYTVETLIRENEPSLRLLAEWILVRLILDDRQTRLNDLYTYLRDAHRYRTGTVCAWISIASHVTGLLTNRNEQIEFINKIFEYISPLLINSNFHIRTFACTTMVKLLDFIERHQLEKQTPYQVYQNFKQTGEQSEIARYIARLQSLFLYQFDPIRDYSLETIFYLLPKLSLIAEDEYLLSEWSIQISQQFHLTFPISVHNISIVLQSCPAGIWKLTAAGKAESAETQNDEGSATIQHKANPYPVVDATDDMEIRRSIKRTQLIVVASLIDKQTNLGGLCRTGEIFGVKELVMASIRVLEDQQFLNLSMTAHKWLNIKQVQERELKDYLIDMQAQGYTIVAVEQTVNSENLYEFEFPEKTLLLLGNEREGIRADLLSLVDSTVEIPQAGVIRSLNVHVSGALCISEYARKYLHLLK